MKSSPREVQTPAIGFRGEGGRVVPWVGLHLCEVPELGEFVGGRLDPRLVFEEFVVGRSNRFAHAAAVSVARAPARVYNPLFICGKAGSGKTHLLHAIGHRVGAGSRELRVAYVTTGWFIGDFVESLRSGTLKSWFARRYEGLDVLLVDDDIDLERTPEFQLELLDALRRVHDGGGQVVMGGVGSPRSRDRLAGEFRTWFEGGVIADIRAPTSDTRLAIVRKKVASQHLEGIPDDVLRLIARCIRDDVRVLEGALISLRAYCEHARVPPARLSQEIARWHLVPRQLAPGPPETAPGLVLEETARYFGCTVADLCGSSRRRRLVAARRIGM